MLRISQFALGQVASCRLQERSRTAETSAQTLRSTDPPVVAAASAPGFLDAGATLAVCTTLFTLIAFDVNAPASLHLLQPLDSAVHGAVSSNASLSLRVWADHALSDSPITAGIAAAWLCLAAISVKSPRTAALTAAAVAVLNVAGALFEATCPYTRAPQG